MSLELACHSPGRKRARREAERGGIEEVGGLGDTKCATRHVGKVPVLAHYRDGQRLLRKGDSCRMKTKIRRKDVTR